MSKIGVSLKINLTAMDQARLFNGQKGQYLDCTVFIDQEQLDQYGNSGMITQDVQKEEKAQGVKGNILGNAKVFWVENGQAPQHQQPPQQQYSAPQQQAPQYHAPQQAPAYNQQVPPQHQQPPQPQGYGRK